MHILQKKYIPVPRILWDFQTSNKMVLSASARFKSCHYNRSKSNSHRWCLPHGIASSSNNYSVEQTTYWNLKKGRKTHMLGTTKPRMIRMFADLKASPFFEKNPGFSSESPTQKRGLMGWELPRVLARGRKFNSFLFVGRMREEAAMECRHPMWWFQILFIFTPIWRRWTHFHEHIFQTGWNHQLASF